MLYHPHRVDATALPVTASDTFVVGCIIVSFSFSHKTQRMSARGEEANRKQRSNGRSKANCISKYSR